MGRCHAIDLEITPIVPDENPDAGVDPFGTDRRILTEKIGEKYKGYGG